MSLRRIGLTIVLTAAAMVCIASWLYQFGAPRNLEASQESIRLRNALIAQVGPVAEFAWLPQSPPDGFLKESMAAPSPFAEVSQWVLGELQDDPSNFDVALQIARHLRVKKGKGKPITSNTVFTYEKIRETGEGYCSDYTQVFNAMALASDLPVREWGISFDRFGGDGHAFNEIFDESLGKWIFIDSFWSFYVRDRGTGTPLSALEFREFLLNDVSNTAVDIVPIVPEHFGFKNTDSAISYYRRGADQLYLYLGNNIFSYDNNKFVKLVSSFSRAAEQIVGILVGVHPNIKIIQSDSNQVEIANLFRLRAWFLLAVSSLFALGLAVLVELAVFLRVWRRYRPA